MYPDSQIFNEAANHLPVRIDEYVVFYTAELRPFLKYYCRIKTFSPFYKNVTEYLLWSTPAFVMAS